MAHFYRIAAAFLLAFFGVMIWMPAQASFPVPSSTTWLHREGSATSQATPAASADQGAARWQYVQRTLNGYPNCSNSVSALAMVTSINYSYTIVGSSCPSKGPVYLDGTTSTTCPANSTLSGGTCTCTAPSVQNSTNNGCVAVDPMVQLCKDNALVHNSTLGTQLGTQYSDTPVTSAPGCAPDGSPYPGRGCSINYTATGAERESADSPWRYTYLVRFTGGACSTVPNEPDSLPPVVDPVPSVCPSGMMPGTATMGGVDVTLCTKPIDVKTAPEKEISKENAGTPQETTIEKESETICTGDLCKTTVTTTTKDATGATVGVTVNINDADKGTVCAKTPENKVCGKGGGTIAGSGFGNPQDGQLPGGSLPVGNITPDALAGFNIGTACPAAQTFTVFGKAQELSYQPLCDLAPKIKPLVLIASALAALFLVYGALTPRD